MSIRNKIRKLFTKNVVDVAQALVSVAVPGEVITANISAAYVEVGEGNIVRLEIGAVTYVAFDDKTTGGAVSVTSSPAVKLAIGIHYVICECKYIRTSVNPTRIELLKL